jgi:hypothetical protein
MEQEGYWIVRVTVEQFHEPVLWHFAVPVANGDKAAILMRGQYPFAKNVQAIARVRCPV